MTQPIVECVPNLSEGRDLSQIDALIASVRSVSGVAILHLTSDPDHHRSVITFAGPAPAVAEASFRLAARASQLIDLRHHSGVHPRIGALDVLPFVPLQHSTLAACADLARQVGQRIWNELAIPVYFYEAAAISPERRNLEFVRRGGFEHPAQLPDLGGPALHPSAGAVITGARPFLIAYNINLRTPDVGIAKQIAHAIRTSSGGFPAVKALGLPLATRGLAQVSMNLTDFETTPIHQVFNEVTRLAAQHGVEIEESELVGLMPRKAVEITAAAMLKLRDFTGARIVENRLESELHHNHSDDSGRETLPSR